MAFKQDGIVIEVDMIKGSLYDGADHDQVTLLNTSKEAKPKRT